MESHEVLNETIRDRGAKSIATDMNLSTSLIYKWCESKDGGGTDNPLDRVLEICELAGNCRPVEWLCEHTNGFRVDNPDVVEQNRTQVLQSTQAILKEFSELLEAVSKGYSDDNRIDEKEAKKIRKEWEDLKKISESFVAACEKGIYNRGQ